MKKLSAAIMVFAFSLTVAVAVMAQGEQGQKAAQKAGCSSCEKSAATPEQINKFKAASIDLRQEMMTKRFELQRENLKETADVAKVAAIKADMEAIKVKIDALKTASNLPESASCCLEDSPLLAGNCDKCSNKSSDKSGKKAADCSNCNKAAGCGCSKKGKGAEK